MEWEGQFFADLCLPFGLKSSPRLWEQFGEAAVWILAQAGVTSLTRYVDDFLLGARTALTCRLVRNTALEVCAQLGLPVSQKKLLTEGNPSTHAIFLGILLDTVSMTASLSPERLLAITDTLQLWAGKSTCSKTELQSLIGVLSFAAKVVRPGRIFLRRMISLLSIPSSHIRLPRSFFLDLDWWRAFIRQWNGVAIILEGPHFPSLVIASDASQLGYGIVCGKSWLSVPWSPAQLESAARTKSVSINFLELLAVVIAVFTFGTDRPGHHINLHCDNLAVVDICNRGYCKNKHLMSLLRLLFFCSARHQFRLLLVHIPGTSNTLADPLSRLQVGLFRERCPDCDPSPTIPSLPPSLN
jgi:hypothetical protein